jgi:hypothetical protein
MNAQAIFGGMLHLLSCLAFWRYAEEPQMITMSQKG